MREEMRSPSEFGGCESPQCGEFGSQSPTFSEPLSSPASPTQQNKSYLLNAKEIVIHFFGVAKKDQYLNPLGAFAMGCFCNGRICAERGKAGRIGGERDEFGFFARASH